LKALYGAEALRGYTEKEEAVFAFPYSPQEFYCLNDQEADLIKSKLTELPFKVTNWIDGMKIILYNNEIDNMAAVMDCGDGNPTMLYGAASEASYRKLQSALAGIGEPI